MAVTVSEGSVEERLELLVARSRVLEGEGVPYPTDQIRQAVLMAMAEGDPEKALSVLKRAETLYSKASRDWMWVRELLARADELKGLAERVGMDITLLESRVGRPREQLASGGLSAGSLERAAASASLALAILNDALPKFCVQEAQKLGESIRRARDRGEDVTTATAEFRRFLVAIQEEQLAITAQRLLDARRAVARIPSAPSVGPLPTAEEEEILREARNLSRRLHRIRGKARDAQSAARLMTQVRAALSEDRRFGTPEEEIEDLWSEVDRLTKERTLAAGGAAVPTPEGAPDEAEGAGLENSSAIPLTAPPLTRARTNGDRVPVAIGIVPPAPVETTPEGELAAGRRRRRREPSAGT
jgi:hypothetical protein